MHVRIEKRYTLKQLFAEFSFSFQLDGYTYIFCFRFLVAIIAPYVSIYRMCFDGSSSIYSFHTFIHLIFIQNPTLKKRKKRREYTLFAYARQFQIYPTGPPAYYLSKWFMQRIV